MALHDMWEKVEGLKAELDSLQPLKKADEKRLWDKFNLEWNFNSNHLEGNTLTYGQTKLLLMFDKTSGDHEVREIEEMKAHDVAVKLIQDYAADKNRRLSEGDVREFNKTILVKPFWKQAITSDGQEARKKIIPGEYKTTPNSVQLASGDIFEYASPEETPAKMQELMQFIHTHLASTETHPLWLAAMLHYKFVLIHPFDDGNGRVARLLMNYVLLHNDYPPVVIKSEDKKNYLNALNKADAGDLEAFVRYIAEQLLWSLELSIKAAKGENIEEEDDVDKEFSIWKKQLEDEKGAEMPKSDDRIYDLYEESIGPLFELFIEKHKKFEELFMKTEIKAWKNNGNKDNQGKEYIDNEMKLFAEKRADLWEQKEHLKGKRAGGFLEKNSLTNDGAFNLLSISIDFEGFKKDGVNAFNAESKLNFEFQPYKYRIQHGTVVLREKLYAEAIDEVERKEIVNECVKRVFESIKQQIGKK